ncbi:hypothetical protein CCUS01_05342 [Colletotrichum cuscutae]|uniref:Uncharacterized protein n=1 Tax=Colletotrichum cuscutae TaxID=1209917 RepID=A0AAI9Y5B3_9PEZI|nr:hypothetical protein CCUS01_05342 [Colletotrichum cuscutae]
MWLLWLILASSAQVGRRLDTSDRRRGNMVVDVVSLHVLIWVALALVEEQEDQEYWISPEYIQAPPQLAVQLAKVIYNPSEDAAASSPATTTVPFRDAQIGKPSQQIIPRSRYIRPAE